MKDGNLIDIGMIGPRGVGKTSLLAGMYREMNGALAGTPLKLVADDRRTAQYLQAGISDLKALAASGIDSVAGGLPPSFEARTLQFQFLGAEKDRHFASMRWTDYPGEWLFPPLDGTVSQPPEQDRLYDRLRNSRVLLIALDAPSLLWREGVLNDAVNKPVETRELVNDLCREGVRPRMVIFTPIKCERWVEDAAGRSRLEAAAKEANTTLLTDLQQAGVGCVYMPVQTVGCVRFSRFEKVAGEWRAHFTSSPSQGFEPKWVVNPLKSVLIEVSRSVGKNESVWDWMVQRNKPVKGQLKDWLGEVWDDSVSVWNEP